MKHSSGILLIYVFFFLILLLKHLIQAVQYMYEQERNLLILDFIKYWIVTANFYFFSVLLQKQYSTMLWLTALYASTDIVQHDLGTQGEVWNTHKKCFKDIFFVL